MASSFEKFVKHIDEAIGLIDDTGRVLPRVSTGASELSEWIDTVSLLDRCDEMCKKYEKGKPTLRLLHHFACSGGTLISKCLSALPNVFLLSELHPASELHLGTGKPKFLPSDITTQARYAGIPGIDDLAWSLFRESMKTLHEHVEKYAGTVVIRDHSHTDFCVGDTFPERSSIAAHLEDDFDLIRLATIRDPVDSYLSLKKNNWEHFHPKGFDQYCERVWAFVSEYSDQHIIRYEDFVSEPELVLRDMADRLRVRFSDDFIDIFEIFRVTGDSGRSSNEIAARPRRELSEDQVKEFNESAYYKKIRQRFNYKAIEGHDD